jgi:hypothetical protein
MTARELAVGMGWPWQAATKALRRLLARAEVTMEVYEYTAERYRVRRVVRYHGSAEKVFARMPSWLVLEVHEIRGAIPVAGRAWGEDTKD